ncbi:MAG: hypothetical protein A4C66_00240 [Nitrospira sp. HN-bin3]|uniref:hypothetical protein n=1 Tax=Nitrospira cf. moscoviensis SBR1015 TaxID=96242 RepID=UPI000A0AE7CC|nr:hypothetical protein [Nitrospira cf. moscoviensis SBR1015]OQW48983.1 MAG: hypothetical protein A4C66_00240 [Nitrospira sp. HN-bin3]
MYAWFGVRSAQYAGAFLACSLFMTGCSALSGESKVFKTTKGAVHLKDIADWSFEASHPVTIDPTIIRRVVAGIVTEDAIKPSTNMPASGSKPMRVFSDEDAEFLAPLLAQGLSEAKPEQIVGFKVFSSAGSGAEPTAGTLYAHKGSLYLTIAPSQSTKGLRFALPSAVRIEKSPSFVAMGKGAMTMVIDYQAVAKTSTSGSVVATDVSKGSASSATTLVSHTSPASQSHETETAPSRTDEALLDPQGLSSQARTESDALQLSTDELLNRKMDELRAAREANKLKDSEIATLKKEASLAKKELRQRADEVKALKASKASAPLAPKKKTAEAHRTR